jgi:hypothetical protein
MATKLEKCAMRVNDAFAERLKAAFAEKFNRGLETSFNIFAMALISQPADGAPFTQAQKDWVDAFDAGYSDAMQVVRDMAQEGRM